MIRGGGGADTIDGGAGDERRRRRRLRQPRDPDQGQRRPDDRRGGARYSQLYLVGSSGGDVVTATYTGSSRHLHALERHLRSRHRGRKRLRHAQLAASSSAPLAAPLDSIVLAGMSGNDTLSANGFPATVTVVARSAAKVATRSTAATPAKTSSSTARATGRDVLNAFGGDDALLHNGGADQLYGGEGNDLFLSISVCDGNLISGGNGRDNASWARFGEGVGVDLGSGQAGRPGVGGAPSCPGADSTRWAKSRTSRAATPPTPSTATPAPTSCSATKAPTSTTLGAGADSILANSGDADPVIDCGDDIDRALVDFAVVRRRHPGQLRGGARSRAEQLPAAARLPDPDAAAPGASCAKPPIRDRTAAADQDPAPVPRAVLTTTKARARAVFRFASSERGSSFRCKLDRKPYRPCVSPRAYMLAPGRHTVRIFASTPPATPTAPRRCSACGSGDVSRLRYAGHLVVAHRQEERRWPRISTPPRRTSPEAGSTGTAAAPTAPSRSTSASRPSWAARAAAPTPSSSSRSATPPASRALSATVARRQKLEVGDVEIDSKVKLRAGEDRSFTIAVELHVTLPSVEGDDAVELVRAAHKVCPYSNATRGNIEVVLTRQRRRRRRLGGSGRLGLDEALQLLGHAVDQLPAEDADDRPADHHPQHPAEVDLEPSRWRGSARRRGPPAPSCPRPTSGRPPPGPRRSGSGSRS